MEPNKQIDYGTLEWFDCKNNFPPMNINLYVDSEHGYGIGRLGKRVKDRSIIWDVQLDSGEVYLVYAFYKVKRWAYIPKDEKTNTKLKHELMLNKDMSLVPCYLKSEADKVIAEKDSEIARLNAIRKVHVEAIESMGAGLLQDDKEIRHQKYKRCLAMALLWLERAENSTDLENELVSRRRCSKWMELAEVFK